MNIARELMGSLVDRPNPFTRKPNKKRNPHLTHDSTSA
jgi:hypothetical protein